MLPKQNQANVRLIPIHAARVSHVRMVFVALSGVIAERAMRIVEHAANLAARVLPPPLSPLHLRTRQLHHLRSRQHQHLLPPLTVHLRTTLHLRVRLSVRHVAQENRVQVVFVALNGVIAEPMLRTVANAVSPTAGRLPLLPPLRRLLQLLRQLTLRQTTRPVPLITRIAVSSPTLATGKIAQLMHKLMRILIS